MTARRVFCVFVVTLLALLTTGPSAMGTPTKTASVERVSRVTPTAGAPYRYVCPRPTSKKRAGCMAAVRTSKSGEMFVLPNAFSGYGPADFRKAYNTPVTTGKEHTIAIVDAYSNANVATDLAAYDTAYGLPTFPSCSVSVTTACLAVFDQRGGTTIPSHNAAWALEIDLDVQAAHAICQGCRIDLFQADNNSTSSLAAAVQTAVRLGDDVISNSYGSSTECDDAAYDVPNAAVVVSSGDYGFGVECPASMSSVISVGGTSLALDGSGDYASETVWDGTGSGCSTLNSAGSWQTSLSNWTATGCGTFRAMNDVAADADPGTGAAIYDAEYSGWVLVGGTSLAAPLIAGMYALAGSALSRTNPVNSLYSAPYDLRDVTTGNNGTCSTSLQCHAGPGYDLPTGLGTPYGLGAFDGSYGALTVSVNDATVTEGENGTLNATFTISLSHSAGQTVSVHYATADGTATAPADYAATSGDLSIVPPGASQTVTVPVKGDTLDEPDETFKLNLSSPSNAALGDASGLGTITDDDAPPSVSVNDVAVTEGNSGTVNATFAVTLSSASGKTVTVHYATADGTATAPGDYAATSGGLTFMPGQTSKPVSVAVKPDTVHEPNETFTLDLSAAGNATLGDASGQGTITNDDAPPDITPPTVSKPVATIVNGTALRLTATPIPLRVTFSASDGSGIKSTELQQSANGSAYLDLPLRAAAATSTTLQVAASDSSHRRLRARATDNAVPSNTSAYVPAPGFRVRAAQDGSSSLTVTGPWHTVSSASFSGGTAAWTSMGGARQSYSVNATEIAIVSDTGPARGTFKVFVDGSLAGTVDLYSAQPHFRVVVFTAGWATPGMHQVELRATGQHNAQSTNARVDLDTFLAITP